MNMATGRVIFAAFLTCACASFAQAQVAASATAPAANPILIHRPPAAATASTTEIVSLTVPKGTAVQVVLDKEVRIGKAGQSIHGRVAEPVYAFDKLVVPVGTEVTGRITQVEGVSGGRRVLDALHASRTTHARLPVTISYITAPKAKYPNSMPLQFR